MIITMSVDKSLSQFPNVSSIFEASNSSSNSAQARGKSGFRIVGELHRFCPNNYLQTHIVKSIQQQLYVLDQSLKHEGGVVILWTG